MPEKVFYTVYANLQCESVSSVLGPTNKYRNVNDAQYRIRNTMLQKGITFDRLHHIETLGFMLYSIRIARMDKKWTAHEANRARQLVA